MYYLFEPLMEDGKQEVRTPEYGEFIDEQGDPLRVIWEPDQSQTTKFPILVMKKFEQDPFRHIRGVSEKFKNFRFSNEPTNEEKMIAHFMGCEAWQAIEATMKELEGEK